MTETIIDDYIECAWCEKVFSTPQDLLRYDNKIFCSSKCLGEYLADKVDDEVEAVWFDTPTNLENAAQEKKAEW